MKRIKGLITAPFTAFTPNNEVDLHMVDRQQKMYKQNGISGVFICGSTGEGAALTMQEKKALYAEWSRYSEPDFHIIAFLGGTSVKECRELAQYAAEYRLDAVAVTAPYYFKPANVEALADFCKQIADAVPDMPFFYYHIPVLSGVNFPMITLLEIMDGVIPNLAGIKYTYENMMDFQLCLNFKDRKYNILWGRDEMLLPALSIGAVGAVGSTYGYNAPIYNRIIELYNHGEIEQAAALQLTANRIITLLGKYGGGTGKAFMKAIGLDMGSYRAPIRNLTDAQYSSLLKDLDAISFYDFSNKVEL
jgi:N-acetylneuraminate lyase